jgi:type I restriction enzyme M protein
LIEEVFSNSNFTNNVNSGNLGEVISIVANDIEESRLLKTDLLGDAIESALSETGGTKDVGLFRTPDHIRQFMTAMIEPTFDDIIFDPACGNGGFLFDAFEFVMRRVDPDREWPGEKAHSELSAWFDEYFKFNQLDFPSIEQTTQFYRNGVTGIEYLGMIRKMAAINFYVRGLNPANIEQGDSLAKYRPVTDHESKSVILANPPFGAQRDQESYPDVWGEYSKESETTILFVKLMFEQLKAGGKCAVVVSEGFHTWDQFSAKALRKMLLDEAQLKAVISLPQGLFVSKSGQGPKTSILIFEKGGKTDWTWFYKITNDGYTMGTNRKEQKGNQLIECLTLWHEYVKHGKQPPETKNQFCIPAEWIKTLDPRIKEKIRTETRADMEAKGKIEREKKEAELDKKIKAKKATEADKSMELKTFDQMLENRIQNEIAKRIDKAHNYSFNLSNYKSTISDSQIVEWTEALKHIEPNGATTVEEIYKKLNKGKPENILPYLVKLNPNNALEADIAREYVSNLENDLIAKHKELNVIKEILKSKQKYPIEKLEGKVEPKYVKIKKDNYDGEIDIVDKISFKDGKIHFRVEKETGMDLYQAEKGDLVTSKINVHQGALALADRKLVCSTHYQVYEIDKTQINPEYLVIALRSKQLQDRVNEIKNGGIKNEQGAEFLKSLEIPLPSIDEQNAIVAQIEKQKAIIEGADLVLKYWEVPSEYFNDSEGKTAYVMSDVCKYTGGSQPPKDEFINEPREGYVRLVQIRDFKSDKNITYVSKDSVTKFFEKDDIMIARYGPPVFQILRGMSGAYNVALMKAIPNEELVLKDYWFYYLQNPVIQNFVIDSSQRTAGQSGVNLDHLYTFQVFLPNKNEQQKIVDELNLKMQVLEGLRKMKMEAQKKINQMLADVWGVEFVEMIEEEINEEVEQ